MESATREDKTGAGIGLLIIAAVAVWALASGKLGGLTMTPTKAAAVQTGTQPLSEPQLPRELISEVPPPGVQTHYLGAVQYAKFSSPIDVGGGFKQWGVTTQGTPVVSMNPPETYSAWEWM